PVGRGHGSHHHLQGHGGRRSTRGHMELEKIGKYQIVGKIGQGAMGEVYKALDPILNRNVAIKTMSASIGADDELRKRFLREAQSAAHRNHPNIITLYEIGRAHDCTPVTDHYRMPSPAST